MVSQIKSILARLSLILLIPFWGYILFLNYTTLYDCYYQNTSSHIIYALMAGTFSLLCLIYLIYKWGGALNEKFLRVVSCGAFVLMIIVQLWLIFTTFRYGLPAMDAQSVINEAVTMAESSNPVITSSGRYFEMYSNNYFITIVFCYYFKLLQWLGIHSYWMGLLLLNMAAMDIGVLFCIHMIRKIKGEKTAAAAAILCLINPTIYVFIPFVYTNTLSIPFITGIFAFAVFFEKASSKIKKYFYCIAGMISLVIGFHIRVTTIIPFIALIIFYGLRGNVFQDMRTNIKYIAAALAAAVIVSAGCSKITDIHVTSDVRAGNFPVTHWIMMGLQGEGGYYAPDEDYTYSFPTKEEKTEANLKVIKERIDLLTEKGPAAAAELIKSKIRGTWASLSDGIYMETGWVQRYSSLQPYIYGDKNDIVIIYSQIYKLMTYTLCFIGIFFELCKKKLSWLYPCLLSFLGFILFYLMWEANCRYAIFITLLFAMAACLSMDSFIETEEKISSALVKHIHVPLKKLLGIVLAFGVLLPAVFFMYRQYPVYTQMPYTKTQLLVNTVNRKYNEGIVDNIINEGQALTQTFIADQLFNEIGIYCKYAGEEEWNESMSSQMLYHFEITDSDGTVLGEADFASEGPRSYYKAFGFPVVSPTEPTLYTISITPYAGLESNVEDRIGFYYFDYSVYDYISDGTMAIDGTPVNQDMVFRVYCKYEDVYTSPMRYAAACIMISVMFTVLVISLLTERKDWEKIFLLARNKCK